MCHQAILFHFSSGSSFCWLQLLRFIPAAIEALHSHAPETRLLQWSVMFILMNCQCLLQCIVVCEWVALYTDYYKEDRTELYPRHFIIIHSDCERQYKWSGRCHILMHCTACSKSHLAGVPSGCVATHRWLTLKAVDTADVQHDAYVLERAQSFKRVSKSHWWKSKVKKSEGMRLLGRHV